MFRGLFQCCLIVQMLFSCHAFQSAVHGGLMRPLRMQSSPSSSQTPPELFAERPLLIEITTKKKLTVADVVASDVVYDTPKKDIAGTLLDSPVGKVLSLVFNPTALIFTACGVLTVTSWIFAARRRIRRSVLTKQKLAAGETVDIDVGLDIFECEKCGLELRPAQGRAQAIFAKPKFRCSRCGSPASAFFNINDKKDPRAIARLERLKEEDDSMFLDMDDEDDSAPSGSGGNDGKRK